MCIRCIQITYILNECSAIGHLPFLVWSSVWGTTGELWPQNCLQKHSVCLVVDFWGFCSTNLGMARTVRPHPDNWMHAILSKQKFNYSFLYLHVLGHEHQSSATKDAVVHLDTVPLRLYWKTRPSSILNLVYEFILELDHFQGCIQKLRLGGSNLNFPSCRGGKGVRCTCREG